MVKKGERLAVLWSCRFWRNSTAFRWRLGVAICWQWARKTLSPLVVHNNLQIDLNEPDLFLDSDSLSQLPKDLLTIPFLHDVLSEDFVFYYQNHADRLGIEGSIRRIVYEHDLTLKDKLFSSLLDQPAQAALWHDKQGHLSHYMVLIQRSGLSKLLEPLLFAATSDSQLSKTEISSIKINSETVPVYQLRYNGNNALMFATYQNKMLVFSSTDMLFKDDQQDTEATAIAGDLLSGKKRWQASFGTEERAAEKTPVRQRIVVSARLLGFGYQRLMPSFAGVRFEMGNDGWHSFVALNDESASVDTSFDFTPVWNSMPAGASFCVVVPYSHGIAEEMLSHISQENDKLNGALDGAAGLCWYADSKLQTPLFVGQFDGTAEQAQLRETVYAKYWCARKQSARRCFADKPDSAGRSANLASRSEFPIRSVSESAGGATRSINVGLFFPRVAGDAKQNAAFLPR